MPSRWVGAEDAARVPVFLHCCHGMLEDFYELFLAVCGISLRNVLVGGGQDSPQEELQAIADGAVEDAGDDPIPNVHLQQVADPVEARKRAGKNHQKNAGLYLATGQGYKWTIFLKLISPQQHLAYH